MGATLSLPPLPLALGLGGAVPFVGLALALVLGDPADAALLRSVLAGYAGVILAFLGGVHWGLVVAGPERNRALQLAASVVPALCAWPLVLLDTRVALHGFAVLFALLYVVERPAFAAAPPAPWYPPLRGLLTGIVVVSLVLAGLA